MLYRVTLCYGYKWICSGCATDKTDVLHCEQGSKVLASNLDYHSANSMQNYIKGNSFGSANFCRDLLPTKLELRKLKKYDRTLA